MLRITAATIALACAATPLQAQYTHYSYPPGGQYRATVPIVALEKAPSWDDESDNPLLAARKAIALADEVRKSLVGDDDTWKWSLESASLKIGAPKRWYWLIRFEALPTRGGLGGMAPFLLVAVTMDGIALKPELVPQKPQQPQKRKPR